MILCSFSALEVFGLPFPCLMSQDSSVHFPQFANDLIFSFTVMCGICLEKMFRTHFWDALTFLRRLKAIGLCNILVRYNETTAFCAMWIVCCDISQLWDVKHVTSYFWWSWYSMLCVFVRRRMGIPETFVTKQWWSVNWCTADHTYHTFSCRRCLYCHADCFAYQF